MKHDRGSGTLLLMLAAMLVVALGFTGVAIGQFAFARARAASAADMASLAAASRWLQGDQCGEAARVAQREGAKVVACSPVGVDVVVRVEVPAPVMLARFARLAGRAAPQIGAESRAGPPSQAG